MTLRSIARTSLLARMCLLFGLLVSVTLIASGLMLSLFGRQSVLQSGREVAEIGRAAVDTTYERFRETARSTLNEAAVEMAEQGSEELFATFRHAAKEGRVILDASAAGMQAQASLDIDRVRPKLESVSRGAIESSLAQLSRSNQRSLQELSSRFFRELQLELSSLSTPGKQALERSLWSSWERATERRAFAVPEYEGRVRSQVLARLQLPLASAPVVQFDDSNPEQAIRIFQNYLIKASTNANQEIARVILVSAKGTELLRIPETDLPPNQEPEDWQDSPTRRNFLASEEPYLAEPIRYDEARHRWIRRIVHQLILPETDTEGAARVEPAVAPRKGKPETPFVVVDLVVDSLVEQAVSSNLTEGMGVLLIHAGSGRVVSAHPHLPDAIAQRVFRRLSQEEAPQSWSTKSMELAFAGVDERPTRGRAIYWNEQGNNLWVVVVQPEADVLLPSLELEKGLNVAGKEALSRVQKVSDQELKERIDQAQARRERLLHEAGVRIAEAGQTMKDSLRISFERSRRASVAQIEKEFDQRLSAIRDRARKSLQVKSERRVNEALRKVTQDAGAIADAARAEIDVRAQQAANRATAGVFINSALMLPVFLLIALLAATATARSLVRPINALLEGTQAIATGDYGRRIEVRGEDELAGLALAFNEMAGAIQRGRTELEETNETLAAEKARIQAIIDSSPDGLVMLETSGRVAFINPTALRYLRVSPEQAPVAPFPIEALPTDAAAALGECVDRVRSADETAEYETTEPRLVLQLREARLRSQEGRPLGRLIHMHDLTRERVIDEMKSDFISLVSHELRTPLTSILGFSSYMLTGKLGALSDGHRTAMESIHRQARRLSAIISDFLDISRIESGRIEMKKEPVHVDQIVSRVIADLQPQAAERDLRVRANVVGDDDYPLALGDEQRIVQVFTNLIGNALKFTERGGIDVVISRSDGEVLCRVRDTGCGIPREELDRVFDRFYQVEKVVTRKSGGTGLGLAIVKNIVEAHGGRIWIESEPGAGTEVSFTLPAAV